MRRALLASIAVLAMCATVTSAQAPAVPKGDYGGGTVRKVGTGPFSVGNTARVRVSGDGTRLTRAIFSDFFECSGNRYSHGLGSPSTSLPIAADGTISDVERLSYRVDRRTRATSVSRFKGELGSTGASGTLSVKVRYVDLPTGRVTRCSTGSVRWTASL